MNFFFSSSLQVVIIVKITKNCQNSGLSLALAILTGFFASELLRPPSLSDCTLDLN